MCKFHDQHFTPRCPDLHSLESRKATMLNGATENVIVAELLYLISVKHNSELITFLLMTLSLDSK